MLTSARTRSPSDSFPRQKSFSCLMAPRGRAQAMIAEQRFFMKARIILAAMLLMTSIASGSATIRIFDDKGGQIGDYLAKYRALRDSGERVEIDGLCASACTMILGTIPRNRICVTSAVTFEFHAAWEPTRDGNSVVSSAGNRLLWSSYPPDVRKWISRHGGLRPQAIYPRGPDLSGMYLVCR